MTITSILFLIKKKSDLAVLGSLSNRFNVGPVMDKEEEDNVEAVVVDTVENVGEEGDFSKLEKELKKVQERNTIVERKYLLCEKELRKKTEEAAKLKSVVKDSKQMLDLERQVKENNIFVGKDEDGEKNDSFTEESCIK